MDVEDGTKQGRQGMRRRLPVTGRELLKTLVQSEFYGWTRLVVGRLEYGIFQDWLAEEDWDQALEALAWARRPERSTSRGPFHDQPDQIRWLIANPQTWEADSALDSLLPREVGLRLGHWPSRDNQDSRYYDLVAFRDPVDAWEWLLVQWGVWDSKTL
jgi:hypothetical protein